MNKIKYLPEYIFYDCPKLKYISLSSLEETPINFLNTELNEINYNSQLLCIDIRSTYCINDGSFSNQYKLSNINMPSVQ
jgi:hypothetical protein